MPPRKPYRKPWQKQQDAPKQPRKLAPKHETVTRKGVALCPACTAMMGEPVYPCVRDFGEFTPAQQRQFFKETGYCGKCGQPANTHRPLCRCKTCGCFKLHAPSAEPLEGQTSIFDEADAPHPRNANYSDPG